MATAAPTSVPSPAGLGDATASHLPLTGITVISCEQAVAAPFASRQLADLGARVIKIERPGVGDFARGYDTTVNGLSSHFVWINRNKESLALDLKSPDGLKILHELIASADVFIQNFAPGAAERLGLGADELRSINPRLIHASISGYGTDGPYKDAKAYDALVQAEAGLVSVTGTEEFPAKTGISTADIAAGMYTYSGILTALYNRERTGVGATLSTSLFDSLVEWMGYPLYFTRHGGTRPTRAGTSHAAIAPYGAFTCGDGTQIMLAIQNEREWERFATQVLDRPDMVTDERFDRAAHRYAHRHELQEIIDGAFAELTGEACDELLETAGVAHSRQRDMSEIADHPQLTERHRWHDVDTPAGPISMLAPPVEMSGVGNRMDPIPAVGQNSESILGELGMDAEAIGELRNNGVI
ncbi:CaiB/BaiF CoA transferase family protein [Brevibacterium epidermidis]|uniref:CaiB/BaiF CoA transferase family protein n=1 Tax=Brevibacterium epidermidis TaxID=1698 RepID=UPI000BF8EF1E|nr:CaiB/BaiF CoA-transferase family protein [Brevibacterium epidermidis]